MATTTHHYSRVSGDSDNSLEDEKALPLSDPWTPVSRRQRSCSEIGMLGFILILSILSLVLAAIQYSNASYNEVARLPSSEQADPLSDVRYTSNLADQIDYVDQQPHHHPQEKWKTADGEWFSCGHSPHVARERGCVFDIMSAVWLPKPCYNATFAHEVAAMHHSDFSRAELAEQLEVEGKQSRKGEFPMTNFTWHSDASLSTESHIPLPSLEAYFIQQFDQGKDMVAYSMENFHVAHCLYMMRAALRGMQRVAEGEKDVYVHEEAMSEGHAMHCQNVMMNYEKWKGGVVSLGFGMGWCKKIS